MKRDAFSLIELLVSMSIVGIMLVLLVVSIGSAREAARRLQCQNNMRQFGIGLQEYVHSRGRLPGHRREEEPRKAGPWFDLAPHLGLGSHVSEIKQVRHIEEVPQKPVELMMCPSDGQIGVNYRACGTSGYCLHQYASFERSPIRLPTDSGDGLIIKSAKHHRLSEVTDGVSNTAFVSERLVATGINDFGRDIALDSTIYPDRVSTSAPHSMLLALVDESWGRSQKPEMVGKIWWGQGLGQSAYNHVAPPNHRFAAMFHGGAVFNANFGIVPPTSNHPGGVNLCRADGSVVFVADQIDSQVWIALATIAASD